MTCSLEYQNQLDGGTQHDHETSTNFLSAVWSTGSRALLRILGFRVALSFLRTPGLAQLSVKNWITLAASWARYQRLAFLSLHIRMQRAINSAIPCAPF